MKITYMREEVDIQCMLDNHDITELQLIKKINNCVDGKFTIDKNEYQVFEDDNIKNDYKKAKYRLTKTGVIISDLNCKSVADVVERKTKYVYDRLKNKKQDQIKINGWTIERIEMQETREKVIPS